MSFIVKKIDIKKYYYDLHSLDNIRKQLDEFENTDIFNNITSFRYWEKLGFKLKITDEIFALKNNMDDQEFAGFLLNSDLFNKQNEDNIGDNIEYGDNSESEENSKEDRDYYAINKIYDINELTGLLITKFEYFLLLLYYEYYNILCDSEMITFINATLTLKTKIILLRKNGVQYVYQESLDEIVNIIVNYIIFKYFKQICEKEKVNHDLFFDINREYLIMVMTFILYN